MVLISFQYIDIAPNVNTHIRIACLTKLVSFFKYVCNLRKIFLFKNNNLLKFNIPHRVKNFFGSFLIIFKMLIIRALNLSI
jgi:hypothetical protein